MQEAYKSLERLARDSVRGLGDIDRSELCFYTGSPDNLFRIERSQLSQRVTVVSACSGHGFKYAPAIAEQLADQYAGVSSRK
jgi:sarcosine oxidase